MLKRRDFLTLPIPLVAIAWSASSVALVARSGPHYQPQPQPVTLPNYDRGPDATAQEIVAIFLRHLDANLTLKRMPVLSSRHLGSRDDLQVGLDISLTNPSGAMSVAQWQDSYLRHGALTVATRIHAQAAKFADWLKCSDPALITFSGDVPQGVDMAAGAERNGIAARFLKDGSVVRFDVYYKFA